MSPLLAQSGHGDCACEVTQGGHSIDVSQCPGTSRKPDDFSGAEVVSRNQTARCLACLRLFGRRGSCYRFWLQWGLLEAILCMGHGERFMGDDRSSAEGKVIVAAGCLCAREHDHGLPRW